MEKKITTTTPSEKQLFCIPSLDFVKIVSFAEKFTVSRVLSKTVCSKFCSFFLLMFAVNLI